MADEPTGFLYPFIEAEERDASALLTDLATSAAHKWDESHALQVATLVATAPAVERAAEAMAERLRFGARVFIFGNGGSATDAESLVDLFRHPVDGVAIAASSLVQDRAVLTALANDVGFELVYSRQLIAHARPGDIAIGFSTSGDSRNLVMAFAEARRQGLLTVGFSGYEGGAMAASGDVAHCFVVASDSVHRIQESQAALAYELWRAVQRHLAEEGTG